MYGNDTGENSFIGQLVNQGKISSKVGNILQTRRSKSKNQENASDSASFTEVYHGAVNQLKASGSSNNSASLGNDSCAMTNYDDMFYQAASAYNVPVTLLKAVAKAESNFNPQVVSTSGAQGIMQLMPATAAALGVANPMNPQQNIMGGAKYLSQMLARFDGNVEKALAAYNSGAAAVEKYGGVPPYKETQAYVEKVLKYMKEGVTLPYTASAPSESLNSSVLLGLLRQQNNAAMSLGQIGSEEKNKIGF